MRTLLALPFLLSLGQCSGDETLSGYGAADVTWVLQDLNGQPFPAKATITFPEEGQIAGEAPCNIFTGTQSEPYPWFKTGPLAVTKRACPDLAAESAFFQALETITLAEVSGKTLILSTPEGGEMVFKAQD